MALLRCRGQRVFFSIFPVSNTTAMPFIVGNLTGQVMVARNVLDFEILKSYTLTVVGTDDGVPSLSANTTVIVTLRYVPSLSMSSKGFGQGYYHSRRRWCVSWVLDAVCAHVVVNQGRK